MTLRAMIEAMPGSTNRPPAMIAPGQRCISDIDRELMRFGDGQQHAIAEGMQEPVLADPLLFVDDDPVHDRDLSRGPAKAQRGDTKPDPERFAE